MGMRYVYINGRFEEMPTYIYQRKNGCFEIRKKIGGVLVYWGSFHTLEEAKLYRAYYIGKKWKVNPAFIANRYIVKQDGKFYIVKYINGHREFFGSFDNLDDAKTERDICLASNWDYDLIVEVET